jgi:hypothetical protein
LARKFFSGLILVGLLALLSCSQSQEPTWDFYSLTVVNNPQARDVSVEELKSFLVQDKTDEHQLIPYENKYGAPYSGLANGYIMLFNDNGEFVGMETLNEYVTDGYMCINYSVDLHNSAEQAGIRCAVVMLKSQSDATKEWTAHCVNGFKTKGRGMVYVDAGLGDNLSYLDGRGNVCIDYQFKKETANYRNEILGSSDKFEVRW